MGIAVQLGTRGNDPTLLEPGTNLVLDPAPEHGLLLPEGVAVDDLLDLAAREVVDRSAHTAQAAWRSRRGPLVVDGLDLAWIFEIELLADCFLPAARLVSALEGEAAVVNAGLPDGLAAVVREAGHPVEPVQADWALANPRLQARPSRASRLIARSGVPSRVRGGAVVLPYWHLAPVLARLTARSPGVLSASGVAIPGLTRWQTVVAAVRGGWVGYPSHREREAARRDVKSALGSLVPFDARDAIALALLRQRAPDVVATARRVRAALARGIRLIVLPWDSPPQGRLALSEARRAGRESLVVQHGFDSGLHDPDKRSAEHVALWSERDNERLSSPQYSWPGEELPLAGSMHVTGNPGAEHLMEDPGRNAPNAGPAVVLVDYPARLTCLIDGRVSMRHVAAALDGLAASGRHVDVVLRPHPADPAPDAYLALAARTRSLRVSLDVTTPIEELMRGASLCVGALSTATLQADALGVPTVFLDVSGLARPWPFDGTIPLARDPATLSALVERPVVTGAAAREALGARAGAVDAVCELIESLL